MRYDNIFLHNVEELIPCEGGFAMSRLPAHLRAILEQRNAGQVALHSSGVELRFRIRSGEARIILHLQDTTEGLPAQILYGSFQGGWTMSAKAIGREPTELRIALPEQRELLRQIAKKQRMPFNPDVIRVLLPYGVCILDDVHGDLEPPQPEDLPSRTLLSYGSSITHGSLSLGSLQCYASRIARVLGYDGINLGLAGNCHLEPEIAEYIVARKDWNAATMEMGINMLGFDESQFEKRVFDFVDILARDSRPIFVTDIFGFNGDQKLASRFRAIVAEACKGKLDHISALSLLNDPSMISADLVHPALEGHEQIAARWLERIRGSVL